MFAIKISGLAGYLIIVVGTKVDGYKGQPDNTSAVHCKANILGFVEVLGDFPRLEGVEGAEADEHHIVQ